MVKEVGGAVVVGGCRVWRYRIQTRLWSAADDGQVETARRLLAGRNGLGGVEVDWANASLDGTPLLQAADQNFPEVVKVLLAHRADANKGKNDGRTPLLFAAQKGCVQVATLLLAKGADVNKAAKAEQTPLYIASRFGHKEVVVTLLASGADKTAEVQGWTALSIARALGHREISALLQ